MMPVASKEVEENLSEVSMGWISKCGALPATTEREVFVDCFLRVCGEMYA